MMQRWIHGMTLLAALLVATTGCKPAVDSDAPDAASVDGSKYLLGAEPDGAQDVIAVRKSAQNDDEIVVVGRIGGRENPWVDGLAVFTIVDPSLEACSDIPGDNCEKPWDYCCCAPDKLAASTALVQVVDETGQPVAQGAKELLAVKELDTVVVKGKASRDEEGNLEVLASGLYVRPQS